MSIGVTSEMGRNMDTDSTNSEMEIYMKAAMWMMCGRMRSVTFSWPQEHATKVESRAINSMGRALSLALTETTIGANIEMARSTAMDR